MMHSSIHVGNIKCAFNISCVFKNLCLLKKYKFDVWIYFLLLTQ